MPRSNAPTVFRFQPEKQTMGKRPRQQDPKDIPAIRRPRLGEPEREHLYLVLDDWKGGFSIYKIGMDSVELEPNDQCYEHLPPPATRIQARLLSSSMLIVPVGSKILIAATRNSLGEDIPIFTFDAETAGLSACPPLPAPLHGYFNVAVAIGQKIYLLSSHRGAHSQQQQSFAVMSTGRSCSWDNLPPPPFGPKEHVISYAVSWNDGTIFMTTRNIERGCDKGTYSFDTKAGKWKHLGKWILPFMGQGFFNNQLGAWIGIHRDGYICSCDITPRGAKSAQLLMPDLVMGKKKLLLNNYSYRAWASRATLICMGKNKFGLVESEARAALGKPDSYFLHLTTFSLEYKRKKGELQATIHQPTRSYTLSRFLPTFPIGAFCM